MQYSKCLCRFKFSTRNSHCKICSGKCFQRNFDRKSPVARFTEPPFYGSRSVHVESIKDWNNIIDKIHFTHEDFMKHFEVIKKIEINFSNKTGLITILDNLNYYLSVFILKHNPLPTLLNNNILPFLSLWFSFVSVCLSHI